MTVHRAKWVVATPRRIVENGAVVVAGNRILDVTTWSRIRNVSPADVVDHGPGALLAGPVNAHSHVELSALKGRVAAEGPFLPWVRNLLRERRKCSPGEIRSAAEQALEEIRKNGTAFLGDVGGEDGGADRMEREGMAGWFFREILGRDPLPSDPDLKPPDRAVVGCSLAIHAPHSTPPHTIRTVKERVRRQGLLCSVHLAESEEEDEFVRTGRGAWAHFLEERGIRLGGTPLHVRGPVSYLAELGILDEWTLAVHLTRASREDLDTIRESGARVCICPRSNYRMYGLLPPVEAMFKAGLRPALGTDSLASVADLHVWNEMRFLFMQYPALSPAEILSMATEHGAHALRMEAVAGSLLPGKRPRMAYAAVDGSRASRVVERIVQGEWRVFPRRV